MLRHHQNIFNYYQFNHKNNDVKTHAGRFAKVLEFTHNRSSDSKSRLSTFNVLATMLAKEISTQALAQDYRTALENLSSDLVAYHYEAYHILEQQFMNWDHSSAFPWHEIDLDRSKLLYVAACYRNINIFTSLLEVGTQFELIDCLNYFYALSSGVFHDDLAILELTNDYYENHPEQIKPVEDLEKVKWLKINSVLSWHLVDLFLEKNFSHLFELVILNNHSNDVNISSVLTRSSSPDLPASIEALLYSDKYYHLIDSKYLFQQLAADLECLKSEDDEWLRPSVNRMIGHAERIVEDPRFDLMPHADMIIDTSFHHKQWNWCSRLVARKALPQFGLFAAGEKDENSILFGIPHELIMHVGNYFALLVIYEAVANEESKRQVNALEYRR